MHAQTATPTLSPRQDLFCRYAALGHTLTEAARCAGYSPASARQRGSDLYARKAIQDRVGVLAAYETAVEERRFDHYKHKLPALRAKAEESRQYGVALRALTTEMHLAGAKSPRVERSTKDEEKEADLRERIGEEVRTRLMAELRAQMEAERQAAQQAGRMYEPGLSGTNRDIYAETDVTLADPASGTPDAQAGMPAGVPARPVLPGTFHDVSDEPDDADELDDIGGTLAGRATSFSPTMAKRDFPGLPHGLLPAFGGLVIPAFPPGRPVRVRAHGLFRFIVPCRAGAADAM